MQREMYSTEYMLLFPCASSATRDSYVINFQMANCKMTATAKNKEYSEDLSNVYLPFLATLRQH